MEEGVTKDYVQLKITHTENVIKVMEQICNTLDMSDDEKEIAKVIALFHDTGRFPQIHKYKIDDDHLTENHAMLSINEIREYKVLDEENHEVKEVILKAIGYHNIASIPEDETDEKTILFSKLIRDADKVDIYRVMIEDVYSNDNDYLKELYQHFDFTPKVSDVIYKKLKNGLTLQRTEVKTMLDHVMLQIAWVMNDINFDESKRIIKENHYIETIFTSVETDERGQEIFEMIMNSMMEV